MVTGIYRITNLANGDCYIGQSRNISQRWKQHTQALPADPPVSLIQRAFNKYGLTHQISQPGTYDGFTFDIVEECSRSDLNARELHWINKLRPRYNIALAPPNSDLRAFWSKVTNRTIVQYHNYANELHLPALPEDRSEWDNSMAFEMGHYISTKKRMAVNARGDTIFLIVGIRGPKRVHFFLWSTTEVEEVTFLPDEDLPINVSGAQDFYDPVACLDGEPGFGDFKTRCGNFAYGFQSIQDSDPFIGRLREISRTNLYQSNESCSDYVERFATQLGFEFP